MHTRTAHPTFINHPTIYQPSNHLAIILLQPFKQRSPIDPIASPPAPLALHWAVPCYKSITHPYHHQKIYPVFHLYFSCQYENDLKTAVAQSPTHISWYQLTIEPNTAFNAKPPKLPLDDDIWSMQEQGQMVLKENNFIQYEISAYAKDKYPALHNMNYWQFGDYLGIGAGAHGKITNVAESKIERFTRHKIPKRYVALAGTDTAITETGVLTRDALPLEFMMNALRLIEGVPGNLFFERTGLPINIIEKELSLAEERNLVEWKINKLKPSLNGLRYLNELLELFVT